MPAGPGPEAGQERLLPPARRVRKAPSESRGQRALRRTRRRGGKVSGPLERWNRRPRTRGHRGEPAPEPTRRRRCPRASAVQRKARQSARKDRTALRRPSTRNVLRKAAPTRDESPGRRCSRTTTTRPGAVPTLANPTDTAGGAPEGG